MTVCAKLLSTDPVSVGATIGGCVAVEPSVAVPPTRGRWRAINTDHARRISTGTSEFAIVAPLERIAQHVVESESVRFETADGS